MSSSGAAEQVIVVGGGVAGLSAAALLAPHKRVLLLEREPLLASQASGNNAAIHRPLEHDLASAELARRSRQLLDSLLGPQVLNATGLLLVSASPDSVATLAALAREANVRHRVWTADALHRQHPVLSGGEAESALFLHDGGVLDLHALNSGLARLAKQSGAEFRTTSAVAQLEHTAGAIAGVRLADGTQLPARYVVLAAGAWSAQLAAASGLSLSLTPKRRHLVQLTAADILPRDAPVIWRLEDEVYFRPESGGVLASPCDETDWPAELLPERDPAALAMLGEKLARIAPKLADARVRNAWACLRTFALDRELVVGADSRVKGLYWLAGLGGRGMSVAPAAAELLANELLERAHDRGHAFSPSRCI
jgi:D-arginine dehydrogenase